MLGPTFVEIQGVENGNSHWCCCWCPETETSSIYGVQLSRFHLKAETERIQSPKRRVINKRQDDG
jgi:hypothetical protein